MLRRIFAILLVLVILIILVGFMLPREITIERSALIDQPRPVIFDVLNDLHHFPQWSPWHAQVPTTGFRHEGPRAGPGATFVWDDPDGAGAGRMWIVDSDPSQRIDLLMDLGESEVDTYFIIQTQDLGQRVTWGMRVEFSTFDLTGRYIGLLLPAMIGKSYAEGLERLRDYLARTPGTVPPLPDAAGMSQIDRP